MLDIKKINLTIDEWINKCRDIPENNPMSRGDRINRTVCYDQLIDYLKYAEKYYKEVISMFNDDINNPSVIIAHLKLFETRVSIDTFTRYSNTYKTLVLGKIYHPRKKTLITSKKQSRLYMDRKIKNMRDNYLYYLQKYKEYLEKQPETPKKAIQVLSKNIDSKEQYLLMYANRKP